MIRGYTAATVRSAEEPLLAAGVPLMDAAAMALAIATVGELRAVRGSAAGGRVCLLVGAGNNGGDALFAGARLQRRGIAVDALLLVAPHPAGLAALRAAGGRIHDLREAPDASAEVVRLALACDVVLDGLLGIGASGPLREPYASVVSGLAAAIGDDPTGPRVVAVDVPSGIGVDDGSIDGPVLAADLTVTFGAVKAGLLLPPAAEAAGRVRLVELGLGLEASEPAAVSFTGADVADLWPVPGVTDDKYRRGVLGIVAGSTGYTGAAILAVSGALGAGVGMVRFAGEGQLAAAVLASHPEVVAEPSATLGRVQAWTVGSGVDPGDPVRSVQVGRALDSARSSGAPAVVDAGALALLPEGSLPPTWVLTPHAGEMAVLLGARAPEAGLTRDDVEADPVSAVRRAVALTGATVLLKGATTLVAGPGTPVYAQAAGPSWLATAGAGDVLAGVLGALVSGCEAEVREDPGLTARLATAAAFVHGRAAHAACPHGPVSASAVASALPRVIADVLS